MKGTFNRRGKPKGTGLVDGKNERTLRRERAAERQAARDEIGPFGQLAKLDRRLGKGEGAARERAPREDEGSRSMSGGPEPEKQKRAPLSATEKIVQARDQQLRYVEKLNDRLSRKRLDVVAAETQYASAFEELQRLDAALPYELRQKKPQPQYEPKPDPAYEYTGSHDEDERKRRQLEAGNA